MGLINAAASVLLFAAAARLTGAAAPQAENPHARGEIVRFVREALRDRVLAGDIPDFTLIGDRHRLPVLARMPGAEVWLTQDYLPDVPDTSFELITLGDAEARAKQTGREVVYLVVDAPRIEGDEGTITLGVDMAMPEKPGTVKLCCCTGRAQFHKAAERWVFVKWISETCS
jgi:hypothetical protein